MKKENFLKLFKRSIKSTFSKGNLKALKYIPKTLNRTQKIILLFLSLLIMLSGAMLWYRHWINVSHLEPTYGGNFMEGIVGEAKDLEKHTARLTNVGLTKITETGEIKGDLAESWEILDDGKTYQFKLRPGYFAGDLIDQLQSKNLWTNIDISAPSENIIAFKFKQPFSPFLFVSTEPLFPYGPYKISKEEKNKITLSPSENYWQGTPYIEKVIINLYANRDELNKAAQNHEIDGYLLSDKTDYQMTDSQLFEMPLPRELNLFFNLNKDGLKNVEIRKRLRDGQPHDADLNLDLVTSDLPENLAVAERIKSDWLKLKVNVNIKKYNNIELQKDIIPKREYDVLLYGQDYGPDPDPYPFWHSSQAKADGANLSNYSNKKADKLLEEARQTFDNTVRNQKYEEFRNILSADIPYINVNKETAYYVLSNKVQGINNIFGSSEADRFLNINKWFLETKRVRN